MSPSTYGSAASPNALRKLPRQLPTCVERTQHNARHNTHTEITEEGHAKLHEPLHVRQRGVAKTP
jgi:hypothetical protein